MSTNRYPYGPASVLTAAQAAAIAHTTTGNSKEFLEITGEAAQNITVTVTADAGHKNGDELEIVFTATGTETLAFAGDATGKTVVGVDSKPISARLTFYNGKFRLSGSGQNLN